MRRALLAILLLGLFASAPAPAAAATSPERIRAILRDCEDDGALSGSYRPSELRDAVRNIGTDLDQYSDCRDVISAAVLRGVSGGGSPATGAGGTPAAPSDTGGGAVPGETAPTDAIDMGGGALLVPEGPKEVGELARLRGTAPTSTLVDGRPVDVSAAPGLATIVAHDLPTPVVVALALLVAGALGAALPPLRRHVLARRAA